MRNYLKNMGWMLTCLVSLILAGCSGNPKLSETNSILQVQAEQVRINTYRKQVLAAQERLTQVLPQLKNPPAEMPPSQLSSLTTFLLEYDCLEKPSREARELCYRVTRVLLINTTRALDDSNMKLYASQRTISQLIDNINVLIESLALPE